MKTTERLHQQLRELTQLLHEISDDEVTGNAIYETERVLAETGVELGIAGYERCPLCGTAHESNAIKNDKRSHVGRSCTMCEDISHALYHFFETMFPPPPYRCVHGVVGGCRSCQQEGGQRLRMFLNGLRRSVM